MANGAQPPHHVHMKLQARPYSAIEPTPANELRDMALALPAVLTPAKLGLVATLAMLAATLVVILPSLTA